MSKHHKLVTASEMEEGAGAIFLLFICLSISLCAMAAVLLLRMR